MLNRTAIISLIGASLLLAQGAHSRNLYRYTNAEGTVVVDYKVPSEYVARGYEVLNEKGVVIEVVPRELTEEERKVHDAQRVLEEQARAEEQRLREWDESLLLRYSTIADIEDARERALRELRIRVNILKSNKRSLRQQVENYQSQAADIERRGGEVDIERLQAIEDLQGEIASTDRAIADRQREIEEVSAAYEADIERFALLLEVVEMRRKLLAQERQEQE
jgi:hypothetical protein